MSGLFTRFFKTGSFSRADFQATDTSITSLHEDPNRHTNHDDTTTAATSLSEARRRESLAANEAAVVDFEAIARRTVKLSYPKDKRGKASSSEEELRGRLGGLASRVERVGLKDKYAAIVFDDAEIAAFFVAHWSNYFSEDYKVRLVGEPLAAAMAGRGHGVGGEEVRGGTGERRKRTVTAPEAVEEEEEGKGREGRKGEGDSGMIGPPSSSNGASKPSQSSQSKSQSLVARQQQPEERDEEEEVVVSGSGQKKKASTAGGAHEELYIQREPYSSSSLSASVNTSTNASEWLQAKVAPTKLFRRDDATIDTREDRKERAVPSQDALSDEKVSKPSFVPPEISKEEDEGRKSFQVRDRAPSIHVMDDQRSSLPQSPAGHHEDDQDSRARHLSRSLMRSSSSHRYAPQPMITSPSPPYSSSTFKDEEKENNEDGQRTKNIKPAVNSPDAIYNDVITRGSVERERDVELRRLRERVMQLEMQREGREAERSTLERGKGLHSIYTVQVCCDHCMHYYRAPIERESVEGGDTGTHSADRSAGEAVIRVAGQ